MLTCSFQTTSDASKFSAKDSQPLQTSPSKFADSGFAKLAASSASPFAAVGATKSVFGGGAAASPSPFASFGAPPSTAASTSTPLSPPKLSFGSKDASAPSPFAAINGAKPASGGFGGGFGGGSPFSSALGGAGPRTGNFASPGQPPIIKSDKPAKPFGAPESDAEDDSDDDGEDGDEEEGGGSGGADADREKDKEKDETASTHESTPTVGEDEKKGKFKRGEFVLNFCACMYSDQVSSRRRRWRGWRDHHCPSTCAHVLLGQDPERGQHRPGRLARARCW